ncbi:MAG: hypothetical protein V2A55_00300 [Candidatus Jorgensenbacteria bacterium]
MDEEKTDLPSEGHFRGGRKKVFWIVFGAFLALFILAAAAVAWQAFDTWRGQESVDLLYEGFKQGQEELYQRQLADTYGGTTPQETLRMYIEAVEAGNYELASKYFIEENREEELQSFNNVTESDIKNYLEPLQLALEKGEGDYSLDEKYFSFDGPILVSLTIYPNGIWKIVEI